MLPHEEAEDAEDSRRSMEISHLLLQRMLRRQKKLTVRQVITLSLILSFAVSVVLVVHCLYVLVKCFLIVFPSSGCLPSTYSFLLPQRPMCGLCKFLVAVQVFLLHIGVVVAFLMGLFLGVWALFFTAIFPSSVNDYLTITKCVMVATWYIPL